jgi:hypothetical protein
VVFWQLTIDASNPALLARFWARALGYQPMSPSSPETTWWQHYRARLGDEAAFDDRIFDPDGLRPPIWFQEVPEAKAGKNRLHVDLYPTGRALGLSQEKRHRGQLRAGRARIPFPARREPRQPRVPPQPAVSTGHVRARARLAVGLVPCAWLPPHRCPRSVPPRKPGAARSDTRIISRIEDR